MKNTIALAKGHHGIAEAFQILRHLNRAPAVEGYLRDVVPGTEFLNKFLDISIVDHITDEDYAAIRESCHAAIARYFGMAKA